ncbi:MAG: Ig-like domain-containing protein [bacterium]
MKTAKLLVVLFVFLQCCLQVTAIHQVEEVLTGYEIGDVIYRDMNIMGVNVGHVGIFIGKNSRTEKWLSDNGLGSGQPLCIQAAGFDHNPFSVEVCPLKDVLDGNNWWEFRTADLTSEQRVKVIKAALAQQGAQYNFIQNIMDNPNNDWDKGDKYYYLDNSVLDVPANRGFRCDGLVEWSYNRADFAFFNNIEHDSIIMNPRKILDRSSKSIGVAPIVSNPSPSDGATITTSEVDISCTVSDGPNGSGVEKALFTVDTWGNGTNEIKMDDHQVDESGTYTARWNTQNISNGSHTIYVQVWDQAGNRALYAWSVTVDNPVVPPTSQRACSISLPDQYGKLSCNTWLSARLMNWGGSYIGNETLIFKVNGNEVGRAITDQFGVAKVNYIVPNSVGFGEKGLVAVFPGDAQHDAASAGATLTIAGAATEIITQDAQISFRNNGVLSARLTVKDSGPPIAGKTLVFQEVNNSYESSGITDADGWAQVSFPGKYAPNTISVTFAGDGDIGTGFEYSKNYLHVTQILMPTTVTIDPKILQCNANLAAVSFTVKEVNGEPLCEDQSLTGGNKWYAKVLVDGQISTTGSADGLWQITAGNGIALFENLSEGNHTVSVEFPERWPFYSGSSNTIQAHFSRSQFTLRYSSPGQYCTQGDSIDIYVIADGYQVPYRNFIDPSKDYHEEPLTYKINGVAIGTAPLMEASGNITQSFLRSYIVPSEYPAGVWYKRKGTYLTLTVEYPGNAYFEPCEVQMQLIVCPQVLYVKPDGNDSNDGFTWNTAKQSIQSAINDMDQKYLTTSYYYSSHEIWVAGGTYRENLLIKRSIQIYGGFSGNETELSQRNWSVNPTIIDGQRKGSVICIPVSNAEVLTGPPTINISGFTIINGSGTRESDGLTYGGGIYYCVSANPLYPLSYFVLYGNIFSNNIATFGAGVYDAGGSLRCANNLFVNNSAARDGGGLSFTRKSGSNYALISNNTFLANMAASNGGAIYFGSASPLLYNNIVAFNSSGICLSNLPGDAATFGNNCVYGNQAYNYINAVDPTGNNGNISQDPLFVDWQNGNAHISPFSPCYDAGDINYQCGVWVYSSDDVCKDIDCQDRVIDKNIDIGADESATPPLSLSIEVYSPQQALASLRPSVIVRIKDADGNTVAATNAIKVAIGSNPSNGTISGTLTVNAVNGSATFSDLTIDNAGTGYTLHATADGLKAGDSNAFDVTNQRKNVPPTFTKGANITAACGRDLCIKGWATGITRGIDNWIALNTLIFSMTPENATLFSSGPTLDSNGTLSFTSNKTGTTLVSVTLSDGVHISEAQTFTITLLPDLPIHACGENNSGQLGDGTNTDRFTLVPAIGLTGVTELAAGYSHSLALKADGTVWAWGSNLRGQLGNGTWSYPTTLVQVSGLAGVTALAGGIEHSLALKADGTVWAWGSNEYGQLGNGGGVDKNTPVQVSGLAGVTAIAGGGYHSLALKADGTVWAWGNNSIGELGDGTTTRRTTPVQIFGLTGVTALASGDEHSLALKSDGTVWAWGRNDYGELGNGTTTFHTTPVKVTGLAGVTALAGGYYFSLALKADGTVWAWGDNGAGQLGDGTTTQRTTPVQVSGLMGVTEMAGGGSHSLAVKTDGTVWAWGNNYYGQLGDGTTTYRSTPVQMLGVSTAQHVAAGVCHSLVLVGTDVAPKFVVNIPPVATAQAVYMDESIAKNITLAGADEDRDPLTYSVVANPKHGILLVTASNDTYTYTPDRGYIGNDSFTFKANDGMADSAVATVSISVAPPLQLTASLVSPTAIGTPVKLTVTSTSASILEYKFRVKYVDPLGASVWATIQEYGDKNTATWKPAEARNYIVIAYARLKGSTVSYHAYRELVLTIKPAVTDIRVVINPAAPVVSGTPVRISATPVNGGTVEYRFKVKYKLPDGTYLWQTLQEYSPMRTCTWTPAEAHPYILYVYAREVGKTAVTYEVFKEIQYLVKAPVSALSLIASCPSPTGVGTPVKLTATATDGVTLEYKFYALYNNANNVQQTELIKDYASSNVVTWSPKLVTNYTSVVALAREKGKAVPFEQMAEITSYKVVAAVSNLALTALPRSTASIGSSIVLTTTATGGGTLEYMFKAKYTGVAGIVWFTLQDWGLANICTWTPTAGQGAHAYTIIAYAREKGTTPYKVYRELAYTVTP